MNACWLWQRCRIEPFVALGKRIRKNLAGIEATLRHGLSSALMESTNTKTRLLIRMALGFASPTPSSPSPSSTGAATARLPGRAA